VYLGGKLNEKCNSQKNNGIIEILKTNPKIEIFLYWKGIRPM